MLLFGITGTRTEIENIDFAISLKAYGDGPLQLSTDKNPQMFTKLKQSLPNQETSISGATAIAAIMDDSAFGEFGNLNVLPLIYDEKAKRCNIMIFDFDKARQSAHTIRYEANGAGRIHPVFRFYDERGGYIYEVRYGDASANALQRGLWTNTKNALQYFDSVTGGWVDYSDNPLLVKLFSHALLVTPDGHAKALEVLLADIQMQKDAALRS